MIIIDPVTLGDTAFSRAGPGKYWDWTGTLRTASSDQLRVTYDPGNMESAPYALIEPAATNLIGRSREFASWSKVGVTVTPNAGAAVDGTTTATKLTISGTVGCLIYWPVDTTGTEAQVTYSIFVRRGTHGRGNARHYGMYNASTAQDIVYAAFDYDDGEVELVGPHAATSTAKVDYCGGGWFRLAVTVRAGFAPGNTLYAYAGATGGTFEIGEEWYVDFAQFESGQNATSPIDTAGAVASRAADVVGATVGLVYSNVSEPEPLWSSTTSYSQSARVRDASHTVYESLIAGNVGNDPTDPLNATKWGKVGATLRWAMFDQYNNTQTTKGDEILVVMCPRSITRGLYLGNVDANEIRVSVVDPSEGLVYCETRSLIAPGQGSSFYNWAFQKIKRSNYFFTLNLPPYFAGLVTVAIRKPGSIAKCGMCALGSVDEFGPSLVGLGTEGKDYSTTTFDSEGVSSTKIRPYAKRMSVDVMIDNDDIDFVHTRLEELRQRPIVWVGGRFGSTAVFGRYGSFRNVIESYPRSKMALQIEGTV